MTRLFRDYETASRVDLPKTGVSVYARDRSTRVLMGAYAFDDGPVKQFVPAEGDEVPAEFAEALLDPHVEKRAWNNPFEWNIERHVLKIETPLESCRCTMAQAMTLSFPGSLDKAGEIVGIAEDKRKMTRGRALVRKFTRPRKPTKGKPWLWASVATDPEDWDEFLAYNRNDVEAERAIWRKIRKFDLPEHEWDLWVLDQIINERGIPINLTVVENAIRLAGRVGRDRMARLREITGLANPNSGKQLLPWLREQGYPFEDLKKGHVAAGLQMAHDWCQEEFHTASEHADLIETLEIRQEVSKTSVKKYNALKLGTDADGRLRGAFQFAGAQRTWRWSGRRFQPQNLAKPAKWLEPELEQAVRHLEFMDPEALLMVYDKPMDLLSGCVRPVVQADPGHLFADADLSAIENVVLGWLSGDEAILRVFREGLDPYIDFAVDMFGKPYDIIEGIVKSGDKTMRNLAKPPVLGCGFMLSAGEERYNPRTGETEATGLLGYAWNMGVRMTVQDTKRAVAVWREKFKGAVEYWWELDKATRRCIRTGQPQRVGKITYDIKGSFMRAVLPSGRALHYFKPKLIQKETPWGETKMQVSYMGLDDKGQWTRITTHPGKLTENVVQAVARDLLANGLMRAHKRGLDLVLHVHDQIVAQVPEATAERDLRTLIDCMTELPRWAGNDLPLKAAGHLSRVFLKD